MTQKHNSERQGDVQTDSTMDVPVRDASEASKIPITSGLIGLTEPAMVPAATDPEKNSPALDALDDLSPRCPTHSVPALLNDVMVNKVESAVEFLARMIGRLVIDQYKNVYVAVRGNGNPSLLKLGSAEFNGRLVQLFRECGRGMNRRQLAEFTEELRAEAEASGLRAEVWRRVAPLPNGGVVIALHDEQNTHIQIRPGQVEVLTEDSEILFYRSPSSAAMVMPAANGNYKLLRKYLNLDAVGFTLYIAWVTYTLAHPKVKGSNFVILVFIGGEGTGKSHLTKVTIRLVDPNDVGVERLPANAKILAVGVLNRHLVAYDNLRSIAPAMSDALCTTATGGAVTDRKLYTDDDQHVIPLHGAILLNGIYAFIEQPDLAQRCLPLRLEPLPEGRRKSEEDLRRDLEVDMPVIMRGLFDLISKVLVHLPEAEVTNPQRMIEFVRWLAAMEMVDGTPAGIYQDVYADALNEGQLDALLDNSLGSAVLEFAATLGGAPWSGTPSELLTKLNQFKAYGVQRPPRDWPDNEIALSKRLAPLQTALMTQGVQVQFKRGKHRKIDITNLGDRHV
jgi:hypothetical protein